VIRLLALSRRRQHGVGLVELLVTMLLGALIVAGVVALFNANRQSFRLQDGVSLAQEQGSFALNFLMRDLRRAGYPGDQRSELGSFDIDENLNDVPMSIERDVNGVPVNIDYADDQLSLVYQIDDPANPGIVAQMPGVTCTGAAIPAGTAYISNRYRVNEERELVCQGFSLQYVGDNIVGRTPIGNEEALISGVDSFQVMYGVDTTFDISKSTGSLGGGCVESPRQANRFINASQLPALMNFIGAANTPACAIPLSVISAIRSVRIGILVSTEADVDAEADDDVTYTVLDRTLDTTNMPNLVDGRVRRLFVTTVALRNTEQVIE
jgi:type IV pilus assembly protein PilW